VTPSVVSRSISTHRTYETVRQAVNRLEDAGYVTYDEGLSVVDEHVRDAARELVAAASAGVSPPSIEEAYVIPQFGEWPFAFTRVDAVYVWTQGGYQVSRDPDDYPIFIAVREQDIDAWETFFAPFGLPTAFERQPSDEIDGRLQIVLEPRPSLDIEHVEGYPVIPRDETIEYMRELRPIPVGAGDARPDVRGPRPRRHVSGDRTGTDIASITEVTRSSNCSRSSRKQGTSPLWGDTLSQRPMLASLRTSISSSRRTPRLTSSSSSSTGASKKRTATPRNHFWCHSESGSSSASLSSLSPAGVFSFLLNQPHSRLESVRCPLQREVFLLNPSLTNRLHPTLQGNLERFAVHSPTHSTQRCIPGTTTQWSTLERCSPFLAIPPRAGVDDYSRQTVVEVFRERHTRNRH